MPYVDESSTADVLDVLCKRGALLDQIGDGVTDKRELEDRLDWSRSTLNRAFRELEAHDLVECSRGDVDVTRAGEVAVSVFSDVWVPLADAIPVVRHLTDDAPFDATVLTDATVVEATLPDPDAPVAALAREVADAEHVRATVPTRNASFIRVFVDCLDSLDAAEFLVAPECMEGKPAGGASMLEPIRCASACTVTVADRRPPYSLVVFDDSRLWLGIYDGQGKIVGAIINDYADALDWAQGAFQELRPAAAVGDEE